MPRGERAEILLEDAGVDDVFSGGRADALQALQLPTPTTAKHDAWPPIMGGGWLAEGATPPPETRLGLAIWDGRTWSLVVTTVADVLNDGGDSGTTSPLAWNAAAVAAYAVKAIASLAESGTVVVPLLLPQRTITPQGVLFIG